ncbi:CHASE domain-containing protein [Duganella sp. FT3S]|uniref:diguanylate cyclase n=1 Tax=Rugamonas fusca TaxID=2758568 RepID=A0A7W2EH99_9BURK|nr:CHASE domain-containing protein [Rugamonas fusca]MBA5605911.1 CHASE domain-containing protein [Rugamonas fusca]
MTSLASRPPVVRWLQALLRPAVLAGVILAGGLVLTAGLWRDARADAERDAQIEFDFRVRELVNSIAQRMDAYLQVLYGVQGLFASADYVDRAEFHRYLEGQGLSMHLPGIHGVGYMRLVAGAQRAAHVAAVRSEGYPDYALFPPGERELYAPVVYLEPFSGNNLLAFGFDSWSEPVRRATLVQARDSGQPAMSGRIRLLQEGAGGGQSGFLIMLPDYHNHLPHATPAQRRAAIRGWVYAPFRMVEVMAGLDRGRGLGLDVEIYDGDGYDPAALMYDSAAGHGTWTRHTVQSMRLAGHRWTLRIGATPAASGGVSKPELVGGGGVALSVLLAGLAWLLARSRAQANMALAQAHRLASELRDGEASLKQLAERAQRSQAMLRSILDSTVDGILVDSPDGTVFDSNRRFRELWNLPEQLDWQADGAVLLAHMASQLVGEAPLRHAGASAGGPVVERRGPHSTLLHTKDGRVIEQVTRSLTLGSVVARLWSFRDVTEATRNAQREQTRRQVLELLATGAPLQTILESVVLGVEADHPGMMCSILLLDEAGEHLLVGAAPSLPAFFNAAVHGMSIHSAEGSCCRAAQTGQRVIVEDIGHDPAWAGNAALAARAGLGSCWSDPILGANGKVLGTFAIYHREPHRPSLANIALIEQAARLAGIAIEQARAAQALRAGEARFRSLYDNAPVALWEQDWSAVRAALSELALQGAEEPARYLQAHPGEVRRLAGLVRILDANGAALAQVGAAPGSKDLAALSLAQLFDADAMPAFARAVVALAGGQQLFACEGSFQRLDGKSRLNELTLLVMPGHTLSLDFIIVSTVDITERRRMNDELLVLATTDFLTGLPNRREFMRQLDAEQARLQRDVGGCAAVLMLDLDLFKHVNDEYGHATGDAVLRHLAGLMRDSQRKIDILGRVGGEEFAILLPGADLDAAGAFAERLRQRIADTPLQVRGQPLPVTVSVGIAALSAADSNADQALIRADQALYRAKRGGRNRVERMPAG